MKVFLHKHALTRGIIEIEGKFEKLGDVQVFRTRSSGLTGWRYLRTSEYSLTYAEALQKAEYQRQLKLATLRRQISKYESMSFEPIDVRQA